MGAGTYIYTIAASGECQGDSAIVIVTEYDYEIVLELNDDEIFTEQNNSATVFVLDNDIIEGGSYEITSYSVPLNGTLVINADRSITYTPAQDYIGQDTFDYMVRIISECGEESVATATVDITVAGVLGECYNSLVGQANNIYKGYGFSPNGDGLNDYFEIEDLHYCFPEYQMEVYNRWGNKVFDYKHNGDMNSQPVWWDGKSDGRLTINKGEVLPAGTYFYIIYLNEDNFKPVSGYVYLTK